MVHKGWEILQDGDIIHIIPADDLQPHSEKITMTGFIDQTPTSNCKCSPKIKSNPKHGTWIIVHGAFDGREALEETN